MGRIGLVHPNSLLGKELRGRLEKRPELASELVLLATDEEEVGTVAELAGEATFVKRLDPRDPGDFDLLILTGDRKRDQPVWSALPPTLDVLLLSRGTLPEDAPLAFPGFFHPEDGPDRRWRSPDPGTVALATLLEALAPLSWKSAFACLLLPVSWVTDSGLDHLFEEARSILNFSSRPEQEGFPGQIAFNLLPVPEAGQKIEAELRSILGSVPPISVATAYVGVFHGISGFLQLELSRSSSSSEAAELLRGSDRFEWVEEPPGANPVAAAREETFQVGPFTLSAEGNHLTYWFSMDNLVRGQVDIAEALIEIWIGTKERCGA